MEGFFFRPSTNAVKESANICKFLTQIYRVSTEPPFMNVGDMHTFLTLSLEYVCIVQTFVDQ